jgi:hypothetical protein
MQVECMNAQVQKLVSKAADLANAESCGVCGKLRSMWDAAEYAGCCGVCGMLRSMRDAADLANAEYAKSCGLG